MIEPLTIWCNSDFPSDAAAILTRDIAPHRLIFSTERASSVLTAGSHDPLLAKADVAFGQPDPKQVIELPHIKWVQLTSAGYTRYDTDAFRAAITSRGGFLTNSSNVYAEPCAEHAMSMIMALARQLPQALDDQRGSRRWPSQSLRAHSRLLSEQSILIYGFGSIARELVTFLKSFHMKITGVRRHAAGNEGVHIVSPEQADSLLSRTDHVMNILPASAHTEKFFDARRFALFAPSTFFYNIGRGTTVDQIALHEVLSKRKIAGAYLDVTEPEPLPADHPLWQLPNCWITPHAAGGHHDEPLRLVRHFRENLARYGRGEKLVNQVI